MLGVGYLLDNAEGFSIWGSPIFQLSSNAADTSFTAKTDSKFAFIQFMQNWGNINFTLGTRFENTTFGNAFAPRIGITFANETFNAKLLFGQAYRTPQLWQAYSRRWPPTEGNELKPEITRTYEFETGYKFSKNINLKLNAFYLILEDKLIFVPEYYSNGKEKLYSLGCEGELQIRYEKMGAYLNISYAKPVDSKISDNSIVFDSDEKPLAFLGFPALKINAGGYYKINKFSFAPSATFLGKRYSQNSTDVFNNKLYTENKPLILAIYVFRQKILLKTFRCRLLFTIFSIQIIKFCKHITIRMHQCPSTTDNSLSI